MVRIAGLHWGRVLCDHRFVNMYMFTATCIMHLFSICTDLFCFLLCGELKRHFTSLLSRPSLPPWSVLQRLLLGETHTCSRMIRIPTEWRGKKNSMEMNKPTFLLLSFPISLFFLLMVIYSNGQDMKQCFVGKSLPEFYGL